MLDHSGGPDAQPLLDRVAAAFEQHAKSTGSADMLNRSHAIL